MFDTPQPARAIPPGAMIERLMRMERLSHAELANKIALTEGELAELIRGELSVHPLADVLGQILGGTVSFWERLEWHYHRDLARLSQRWQRDSETLAKVRTLLQEYISVTVPSPHTEEYYMAKLCALAGASSEDGAE